MLFSISVTDIGGGLRLYWFQKCSLSLELDEEGREVLLDSGESKEYIEEEVNGPLETGDGLEKDDGDHLKWKKTPEKNQNNHNIEVSSSNSMYDTFIHTPKMKCFQSRPGCVRTTVDGQQIRGK